MRVEGKLELRDLQRMMRDVAGRNTPKGPRTVDLSAKPGVSLLVLVGLDVALMLLYRWLHSNDAGPLVIGLTVLLLVLFGVLTMIMVAAVWITHAGPRALAKQPGVLGQRSYTIEEDGLRVVTEISDALTKWRAINKVNADDHEYLFVYLGERVMGPVIPRRFFESEEHFAEFADELQRRVAEATENEPPRADLPRAVASIKREDD